MRLTTKCITLTSAHPKRCNRTELASSLWKGYFCRKKVYTDGVPWGISPHALYVSWNLLSLLLSEQLRSRALLQCRGKQGEDRRVSRRHWCGGGGRDVDPPALGETNTIKIFVQWQSTPPFHLNDMQGCLCHVLATWQAQLIYSDRQHCWSHSLNGYFNYLCTYHPKR